MLILFVFCRTMTIFMALQFEEYDPMNAKDEMMEMISMMMKRDSASIELIQSSGYRLVSLI